MGYSKRNQKNIKNLSVETDKLRDSQKKFSAETNKQIKETNQGLKETNEGLKEAKGLFETQWGKLMESLVEGDLVKILNKRGIAVKILI